MRDQNLVNKCSICGVWFEGTNDTCSQCSAGVKKKKDLVHVHRDVYQKWAKRLYAIGQTGCEYSPTKYDTERYEKIITIASEFYQILEKNPDDNPLGFDDTQFQNWSNTLYDVAKAGLKFSDSSYDIERYRDVLEIQEDLASAIEATSDLSAETIEKSDEIEKITGLNQEFIADRQIQEKILEMINRTKREILIASPWIWESEEVLKALTKVAEEKRVRVRIMTRPPKERGDQLHKEQIRTLHKLGFQIELEVKLHAKLLLIDDEELLIGSANLVGTSLKRNYEAALWTNHQKTVQDAKIYFTGLMEDIFSRRVR